MTTWDVIRHPALRPLISWGLTGVLLASCIPFIQYDQLARTLVTIQPSYLLAGAAILVFDRWLMALRWHLLLVSSGMKVGLWNIFLVFYKSSVAGLFLPSIGTDVMRFFYLRNAPGAHGVVAPSLIIDKMIGLSTATVVAGFGLAWLIVDVSMNEHHLLVFAIFVILATLPFLAAAGVARVAKSRWTDWRERIPTAVAARLAVNCAGFSNLLRHRRAVVLTAVVATIEQLTQIAAFTTIAIGLGLQKVATFFAIAVLQFLVLRLPISPNGWGVGEFTAMHAYGAAGLTAEAGLLAMSLFHLCIMMIVLPALCLVAADGSMARRQVVGQACRGGILQARVG